MKSLHLVGFSSFAALWRRHDQVVLLGVFATLGLARMSHATSLQKPDGIDPRIEKRVSLHVSGRSLSSILGELSKVSGVELKADLEVAEIRATVLVHDLPLQTVQERLAEALHLSWKRSEGAAGPVYTLFRSDGNRAEEKELIARGEKAFRQGIDIAIGWLSLSRAERSKLLNENVAIAETFRQPGAEEAIAILSKLTPAERESVLSGTPLEFRVREVPAQLSEAVSNLLLKLRFREITENTVFRIIRTGEGPQSLVGLSFIEKTDTLFTSSGVGVRGTHAGVAYADMYHRSHEGAEYASSRLPRMLDSDVFGDSFEEVLDKLSTSLSINIIAEHYRQYLNASAGRPKYPVILPKGEITIERALDKVQWVNAWWKHGDVYLVQRPVWWIDRRNEVGDSIIERIRPIVERRDLGLDDWAGIACMLTKDQLGILQTLDPHRNSTGLALIHPLLRFYGNLSPPLRKAIFDEKGLDVSLIGPDDRERLQTWLKSISVHPVEIPDGPARVVAGKSPVNGSTVFHVFATTAALGQKLVAEQDLLGCLPGRRSASVRQ